MMTLSWCAQSSDDVLVKLKTLVLVLSANLVSGEGALASIPGMAVKVHGIKKNSIEGNPLSVSSIL